MAEIKIEKKKPIWPWILLGLVIVGIVAYVLTNKTDDDFGDDADDHINNNVEDSIKSDTYNYDSTIYNPDDDYEDPNNAMAELMIAMKDSTRFGSDSTYTRNALYNLAKVTVEKAKQYNIETSSALSGLERYTSMTVAATPEGEKMNKQFKSISDDIVSVIENIQTKHMPNKKNEVTKLRQTATKLNATSDLEQQQSTIQTFFRQANDLLYNMNS